MVTINPGVGADEGDGVPSPRIGGGNDSTAWTGGPNVTSARLSRPSSTMARRPIDFKSANSIEQIATRGLPENRHIGPDEKTSKITLTSWVNSTRSYMEERGMDTVFHVYDASAGTEVYLLADWGSASPSTIESWVATLRKGVPDVDGSLLPICDYDLDNLKWSGKAILNSITLALWETVEKDLGVDTSGPEAFASVVSKLQQVSSAAVRTLVDELKGLSLLKEPGQDVELFGGRVVELCRRITGTGMAPTDLVVLAASTFLECDVLSFKLKAIDVHDSVDENPQTMNWDAVVRTLKNKYQSLKGQGLWTPQLSVKKKDDELTGLLAAINKLSVQVNAGSNRGGSDGEPIRCYGCGQSGHISTDCPKKQGSSGLRSPPKESEPHTKTIKGASHSWCAICRRWTTGDKEHSTEKHVRRERPSLGTVQPPARPAPAPAPAPAVGGLASSGTNSYHGGGLHLSGGLFLGQLVETDPVPVTSPTPDPSICLDDFFHVESTESTPPSESNESSGMPLLRSEQGEHSGPGMHETFGIYMLTSGNSAVTTSTAEMKTFLTRVSVLRDTNGGDAASWVNAVSKKLEDVGIITVPILIAEIHTVNSKLRQVGHTQLLPATLDMMAREAVRMRAIGVPPTGPPAEPLPLLARNSDEMSVFLRSVAEAKGIVGPSVDIWAATVRSKLERVEIITVRSLVSEIVMLNRLLHRSGAPMMHFQTLDLLARKGVEALLRPMTPTTDPPAVSDPTVASATLAASTAGPPPHDGDASSTDEPKMGQCLACDGTGLLWTHCTNCEDSGMVYSEGPDDDSKDFDHEAETGTCPNCQQTGTVGHPCDTCSDPNVLCLNFQAGL